MPFNREHLESFNLAHKMRLPRNTQWRYHDPMIVARRTFLSSAAASLLAVRASHAETPDLANYGVSALIDGSGMVRIPAGEFSMGSDKGNADEKPVHRVRIRRPFEMAKFEVTQTQWETVMTDAHPGDPMVNSEGAVVSRTPSHFRGATLPVESVSWDDVQVFLARLNARDDTHVYRLPTEAEWEYASKGGTADADAWYKANSDGHTQPVGLKKPNAWGLYDMQGNVAEWVADWYRAEYYEESPLSDPAGPRTGTYRVFRGGCWFDPVSDLRTSFRGFDFPVSRFYNVGFRVVRTAK